MKALDYGRYALSSSVAAAMLAGCGGSQPPIGAPGTMPHEPARTGVRRMTSGAPYKLLYRFHPLSNGEHPAGALLDIDGTLYGTTVGGGLSGNGTVYGISTRGVHKLVYSFGGSPDGAFPTHSLLDVSGTLYGTTYYGGGSGCRYTYGCGTVYSISISGSEKVLYAFKGGKDGGNPSAGLIDVNGTLYGTTAYGGGSGCYENAGCGTVFRITTNGKETVLHRFAGGSDGAIPEGELLDLNGVLYGTTNYGGAFSGCYDYGRCGTVYRISTAGKETVLYDFKGGTDGGNPSAGLISVNGTLYGTTKRGGGSGCENVGCGTVFQMSASGSRYSILHSFQGKPDGANPSSGVIAVQGTLYGTTYSGGFDDKGCHIGSGYGCGTVYSISSSGAETVLYRFAGRHNGTGPSAPLTNVNGTLYGATTYGGSHNTCCYIYGYGTVFALSP